MSPRRAGAGLAAALAFVACTGMWAISHVSTAPPAAPVADVSSQPSTSLTTGPVAAALQKAGLVSSTNGVAQVDVAAVSSILAKIPTDAGTTAPAYSRAAYGPAWADTDHNGCDQRNDVLTRDLVSITYKPDTHNCVVLTGILDDAYTGKVIDFTRGERSSAAVQIDHIVPLSWEWQHGASGWTETRREQLATDLTNLQAVDGPTNESKSDQGPATWLPPASRYQCLYVTRFAYVVSSYHLTIDTADRTAIDHVLNTCK